MSASHYASPSTLRQPAGSAGAISRLARLRALIVEDEMFVAWHIEEVLERLHVEVCGIAARAELGIEKAVQLQPDLVLMDVNLGPGPDGVEAARQIRRLTGTRFLFLTAYSDPSLRERIQAAAPNSPVLQKPASSAMIEAALLDLFA